MSTLRIVDNDNILESHFRYNFVPSLPDSVIAEWVKAVLEVMPLDEFGEFRSVEAPSDLRCLEQGKLYSAPYMLGALGLDQYIPLGECYV